MLSLETIQSIREDYYNGLTHKEFLDKYGISKEVVYAIIYCQQGLTLEQIQARLEQVSPGMTSKEIRGVMDSRKGGWEISLALTPQEQEEVRQRIVERFNLDADTPLAVCLPLAAREALEQVGINTEKITIQAVVPPAE